jgi:hypothetical protein
MKMMPPTMISRKARLNRTSKMFSSLKKESDFINFFTLVIYNHNYWTVAKNIFLYEIVQHGIEMCSL